MGRHSSKSGLGARAGKKRRGSMRAASDSATVGRSRRRGLVEESPKLPIHKQRRKEMLKKSAIAAGVVCALIVATGAIWAWQFVRSVQAEIETPAVISESLALVVDEPEARKPFTILLLGSDVRPKEEVARADTIIVAKVDPETKEVWLLSIPRDTKVNIPGHGTAKINSATFYGGVEGGPALMVETVEEFLGVDINYYMELDFNGFQTVVDAMGGIWIDVDTEIDDWKASSHSPGHRAQYIAKGLQLLDGEHALTYVRSRDFIDADFTRMRHQQVFFKALAQQATSTENILKVPGLVREISKSLMTNMRVSDLIASAQSMKGISEDNLYTATVMGEWISPYVVTDEEEKSRLMNAFLAGYSFDATETPVVRRDESTISVTIRNGAGIAGCASGAASVLEPFGYDIGEIGNTNQFVYPETFVIYKDDILLANQVAIDLPIAKVIASRGMYSFTTDILVVVGKDWNGPKIVE